MTNYFKSKAIVTWKKQMSDVLPLTCILRANSEIMAEVAA